MSIGTGPVFDHTTSFISTQLDLAFSSWTWRFSFLRITTNSLFPVFGRLLSTNYARPCPACYVRTVSTSLANVRRSQSVRSPSPLPARGRRKWGKIDILRFPRFRPLVADERIIRRRSFPLGRSSVPSVTERVNRQSARPPQFSAGAPRKLASSPNNVRQ
jgi:hypothetical protein